MAKIISLSEDDFMDFQVYGILTQYNSAHQFIYQLNQNQNLQFKRTQDLDLKIKEQWVFFPMFEWLDEQTQTYYYIIKNQSYTVIESQKSNTLDELFKVTPILIPQYKVYNYILKVVGDEREVLPIKTSSGVQKITAFEVQKIKTKERLIF